MANRTVKDAHSVHGTNPQYLIEKIIRSRIYESKYWKEHCFALTAELLVDKAIELRYIGGVYSGLTKPTPFLCLVLKMLQIQPDKDIVIEFIKQEDYKYARAIGAFYLRLVGESAEIYKYLETLYNDFRKIKKQDSSGKFSLIHMDEFIDSLLTEERVCDVILPRLQKRSVLEEANILESRQSLLDEDLEDLQYNEELDDIPDSDADTVKEKHKERKHEDDRDYRERSKDRERARERNHRRNRDESPHLNHRDRRDREHDYDKERRKDKEDKERREKAKSRRRSRSRSVDRARDRGRRAEREYSPEKYRNGRDRERGYRH